jgi:hypothetical protein
MTRAVEQSRPSDAADGFHDVSWNLGQVIAWVETRSPHAVDALSDITSAMASRDHSMPPGIPHYAAEFASRAAEPHCADYTGPMIGKPEEVRIALLRAFQSNKLKGSGRRAGSESRENIPALEWQDLTIDEDTAGEIVVRGKNVNFAAWVGVRVDREDLLNLFQPASIAPAEEVGAPCVEDVVYREWIELHQGQIPPSRNADRDHLRAHFPSITQERIRTLRRELAPREWTKPGRPKKK